MAKVWVEVPLEGKGMVEGQIVCGPKEYSQQNQVVILVNTARPRLSEQLGAH